MFVALPWLPVPTDSIWVYFTNEDVRIVSLANKAIEWVACVRPEAFYLDWAKMSLSRLGWDLLASYLFNC